MCSFWFGLHTSTRIHPVQDWPESDRARAVAVSLHGDEGTGKRNRSTMIISWSPLAIHEPSMISKYPFVVTVLYVGVRNTFLLF